MDNTNDIQKLEQDIDKVNTLKRNLERFDGWDFTYFKLESYDKQNVIDGLTLLLKKLLDEKESASGNKFTCCLCGNTFAGSGNNPWPLSKTLGERCCDECNAQKVIPARISNLRGSENDNTAVCN